MRIRALAALAALLLITVITACGQPRPVAEQGPVCQSMARMGHLPEPWPDITPSTLQELGPHALAAARPQVLADEKAVAFRARLASQAEARRQQFAKFPGMRAAGEPTKILSVSAGGAWGAFSIGFLDGWGQNPGPDRRPKF